MSVKTSKSAEHLKASKRGEERFICTAVGWDLERSPVLFQDESFQMCKIISACREGLGGDHPAQVRLHHGHRGIPRSTLRQSVPGRP